MPVYGFFKKTAIRNTGRLPEYTSAAGSQVIKLANRFELETANLYKEV